MAAARVASRAVRSLGLEPLASTLLRARLVRRPAGFVLAEWLAPGRVVAHRLRATGLDAVLEHGSPDVEAFDEIFYQRIYRAPPEVEAALAPLGGKVRILDVGANIGLFGVWALGRWPDATIDAFEPDPRNASLHRRTIERNGLPDRWRLHCAAATSRVGALRFAAGRYALGRPARPGDTDTIEVEAVDILPALQAADFVKIDAEGSEWEILDDPRFVATAARAIALEYHPEFCPEQDARVAAWRRLEAAGFTVHDQPTAAPPGYGSLWAWRANGC